MTGSGPCKLYRRLTLGSFLLCAGCGGSEQSEHPPPVPPTLDVGDRAYEADAEAKSESERTPYDLPKLPGVEESPE
jgi:hypothetical protein